MKNTIVYMLLFLGYSFANAQEFSITEFGHDKVWMSPAQFKKRFSENGDTLEQLSVRSQDSIIYDYTISEGSLRIEKTGNATYLLTEKYSIPIGVDSAYIPINLVRYQLKVGKRPILICDSIYLKEQLKGRVLSAAVLLQTWEELKRELSKSTHWDEYAVKLVDKTAVLGWQLTLAFLNGEEQLLPILENYRKDIFLVNAGESSAVFGNCESLLVQLGYHQFYREEPIPDMKEKNR